MLITRIRNLDGPLSKSLSMVDGKLDKGAKADLVNGSAHRVHVEDLEHFAPIRGSLKSNEALTYGVPPVDHCRVTTQKRIKAGTAPRGALSRDEQNWRWPDGSGIFMQDIDPPHGDDGQPFTAKRFDDLMKEMLPWWEASERMYCPSVSAFVKGPDGQPLSKRGSLRCYAILDKAANALKVGLTIADAFWRHGHGYIEFDNAQRAQKRCPIDCTVWQASRLDFAGPAILEPGLTQNRYAPWIIKGRAIDTEAVIASGPCQPTMAAWASHSLEVRKAVHAVRPEEKRRQRAYIARRVEEDVAAGFERKLAERKWRMSLLENTLTADFRLHFRDKGTVTVADVLKDPAAYDLERLADPNDPTYANDGRIAQFYANDGGKPRIFSHAHGGRAIT
jgi:hypothetical protein